MARLRTAATSLSLAVLLLIAIFYLSITIRKPDDSGYTAHWMRSDGQMLRADSGGSKIRFISSPSAGQYDVNAETHVGQEYTGATRRQYETDTLKSGREIVVMQEQEQEKVLVPPKTFATWLKTMKRLRKEQEKEEQRSKRANNGDGDTEDATIEEVVVGVRLRTGDRRR